MGYYTMSQEDFDTVKTWIQGLNLKIYRDLMHVKEEEFVSQMVDRLDRYDRDIRISDKQQQWLGKLYDLYVNGYEQRVKREEGADTRFKRTEWNDHHPRRWGRD